MRLTYLICCAVVTLNVAVPWARAQTIEDARALEGMTTVVTTVVNLTHQDAYGVADVLNSLELRVRAAAVGPSRLLIRGPRGDIKHVIDDLMPEIDRPSESGSEKTAFIPLGQRSASGLMTLLEAVKTNPNSRYAVDQSSNTLVARATEGELGLVRELLKAVDQPAQSLTLQFFFIRGVIGDQSGAGLPDSLSSVGRTLRANGLGQLSLMAPMIVVAEEGERFAAESAYRPKRDQDDPEDELTLSVQGRVHVESNDVAQLNIAAVINGHYTDKGKEQGFKAWFEAETTISAKLGSYVILAASPSSTSDGDAVALAVRVTRSDSRAD